MMKSGNYCNPFTVAKPGNHNLSLKRALSIVAAAVDRGAGKPTRDVCALCTNRQVVDGFLATFFTQCKIEGA